ncbi:hypothetical protein J6590_070603 [Homalodisca vitripennis]|nr:hypothetical protein J6590_070603 [Homalodisca vitripennis]
MVHGSSAQIDSEVSEVERFEALHHSQTSEMQATASCTGKDGSQVRAVGGVVKNVPFELFQNLNFSSTLFTKSLLTRDGLPLRSSS